ncbi:hypothetical protein SMACR_02808 [Sordaria macrospora]|uniref:WGS project CABT00000000 data, contig 2.12 n=2 Tax=Sordaria macrospora TaxID=5147 RepID=F7VXI9_SORMK|nr:uncharacterized protein SMAC_02808 [Sordaria macrospora k-hell]KAA8634798.1 hypothetical protein SMACR_02808 [Sordaria macrospora]KAH7635078.1 hypothetical protein B0T09DRAFT_316923 [Sordaria sp. MPI-SDFR-AT-0083]WPJ58165.1 hypothetical protein SMAC4_02808 [Sordaria macrospora]CCC10231.1 unnamed protein product [Sordaria macrospora k-hell]
MSTSTESLPITPQAFAAALEDLPVSALHLKVLEIYNSIAHLKYSNEQLRPFAEGIEAPLGSSSSTGESAQNQPDPDCVEAIRENEQVIVRMEERVQLVKNEVERRGLSWTEFESKEEVEAAAARNRARGPVETGEDSDNEEEQQQQPMTNGTSTTTTTTQHPAWMDGTFQTGVIRNGEIVMDDVAGSSRQQEQQGVGAATGAGAGGSLSDEELRRRIEEQLRDLGGEGDEEEGGMHL